MKWGLGSVSSGALGCLSDSLLWPARRCQQQLRWWYNSRPL